MKRNLQEGEEKKEKKKEKKTDHYNQSAPNIFTDRFFIKTPPDDNKRIWTGFTFYAPVQQTSLPFLVDTFQGSNETRDGLDTHRHPITDVGIKSTLHY